MAEPARPFWENDELVAKAAPRQPAKGSRPSWEEDELVATKAETKANPGIWEAIGRGGLQGATLGGGDELYAVSKGIAAGATGGDYDATYERELAELQAANKAAKEEHPWAYGISEAAGIIPGLIAGGRTKLGAQALGLAGRTFLGRSAAAGISGAGIGAIQGGASADGGADERLRGAAFGALGGGVVGAASPTVGAAVGKGVGMVSDAVRSRMASSPGLSNSAAELLSQDLKAAGGASAVRSRLDELGPDARLLDASPSFQGRAQGLAIQPETREMIVDPLVARNRGTNQRLASDLDSSIGPAPIPSRIEAELAQSRGIVGEQYPQVMEGARAVDTSALAAKLEAMSINKRGPAAAAAAKVRGYLDIPGERGVLDPNPQALHATREAIDGLMGDETNQTVRYVLGQARKDVDKLLGSAVPGVKAADARFAELSRQSEGLQRGSQIFDSGKTAIRPADLGDEIGRAALPQGEMVGPSAVPMRMRQGARAEIDRLVGTEANDLNALRKAIKGEGDWNYTKLVQTFGSREGAKVWNAVDRETAFREAYQNIVQGSQTAMRTGAAEGTKVRGQGGTAAAGMPAIAGAIGGPGAAAAALASQGVRAGAGQVMKAADLARNSQVAAGLMRQAGPELDAMIDGLAQRIMAQSLSQMTAAQARELAQIMVMSQGENTGQGIEAGARMLGR